MLERLLADVDPRGRARSSTARSRAASSRRRRRRALLRAEGPDSPRAAARRRPRARRRQGRRRLLRRLPEHQLHERLLRRLLLLRLRAPPRRRGRLRPRPRGDLREGEGRGRARRDRALHPGRHRPERRTTPTTADLVVALKREFPALHIHAFSPEEIDFGHKKSGMPLREYLRWLKDAGLGTIPGTAAEILDDAIRERGLAEQADDRALGRDREGGARDRAALDLDRDVRPHREARRTWRATSTCCASIQKETGGFTEFVPLGFIHEKNVLFNHLGARPGATTAEDLRVIAVGAPLPAAVDHERPDVLGEDGPEARRRSRSCAGANDFGGTLMEESISRESGAEHGENLPAEEMRRLIREIGRTSRRAQHHLPGPAPLRRPGAGPAVARAEGRAPSSRGRRAGAWTPSATASARAWPGQRPRRRSAGPVARGRASGCRGGSASAVPAARGARPAPRPGSAAARARGRALDHVDRVAHGRVAAAEGAADLGQARARVAVAEVHRELAREQRPSAGASARRARRA